MGVLVFNGVSIKNKWFLNGKWILNGFFLYAVIWTVCNHWQVNGKQDFKWSQLNGFYFAMFLYM